MRSVSLLAAFTPLLLNLQVSGCDGESNSMEGPGDAKTGDGQPIVVSEEGFRRQRERLVAFLEKPHPGRRAITDPRLLEALRRVPRHEFVPVGSRHRSYQDRALTIAENQTISQPYVVALMTQLLELRGDEKVLEVGTGSGYQAALLGELAAEVYTIEIRPALKKAAETKLRELKQRGVLRYRTLEAILGDGSKGYAPAEPYDCIVVTAAPSKVPEQLIDQLRPGGRMVVPVGKEVQELLLIRTSKDGNSWSMEFVDFVRFVEMVE